MSELKKTLDNLLKEAQDRVNEVTRELVRVEEELDQMKKRLELANAHQEINDKFMGIFGNSKEPVASPPGGWFYDKPVPYSLTPEGEAFLPHAATLIEADR